VLRPKGTSSYDPKTREMRRLSVVVEKLALEQRSSLAAESAAADVFSKVSDRVAVLEKAFGDLADAVSDELTAARLERKRWSAEVDVIRGVVDACDEKTNKCVERCEKLRTPTFDHHENARLDARAAAFAVAEARAVLAEAERRAAETETRLQSLQDVAHDADAALQAQIDEIRETVVSLDKRLSAVSPNGPSADVTPSRGALITTRDILLAGAASEADVVALRDWTREVTDAHAERLARVEMSVLVDATGANDLPKSGKKKKSARGTSDATPTSRRRAERSSEGSA
jgi:hypothetical protein